MTMLISKAALMLRFRIVGIVTILQQSGLRPDRIRNVCRAAGESKRSNFADIRLADDLLKTWAKSGAFSLITPGSI